MDCAMLNEWQRGGQDAVGEAALGVTSAKTQLAARKLRRPFATERCLSIPAACQRYGSNPVCVDETSNPPTANRVRLYCPVLLGNVRQINLLRCTGIGTCAGQILNLGAITIVARTIVTHTAPVETSMRNTAFFAYIDYGL
jgi:hypothetical protein